MVDTGVSAVSGATTTTTTTVTIGHGENRGGLPQSGGPLPRWTAPKTGAEPVGVPPD